MFLRAIIVDNEQKAINALKVLIKKHTDNITVIAESKSPGQAIEFIEDYKPEVVFLDIDMPGMNGFELLEKLTWKDFNLIIITAHHKYALKALKVNAVDYLLKPIDYKDLQFAVKKIKNIRAKKELDSKQMVCDMLLDLVNQRNNKKLLVTSQKTVESVEVPEIVYFEAFENHTQIHLTNSRVIATAKPLKNFDIQLCNPLQDFMRVHHSFVINLRMVERYLKEEDNIVMRNNKKIALAKSRKEDFFCWLRV